MARHSPQLHPPTPGGAFHSDTSIPVEVRRRDHAAAIVELIREAREAESFTAVPTLTRQLAELTGLDIRQKAPRIKPRPEPADLLDALRHRLNDTQQLRLRASAEGSYVAARDLLRMEADLLGQIAAEVASRAPKRDALTDDQLIDEVARDLLAMPPVMRRAVLARVQAGDVLLPSRGGAQPS